MKTCTDEPQAPYRTPIPLGKAEAHLETMRNVISRIEQTFDQKAAEYVRNSDPFHNFREAAKLEGVHILQALRGMHLKHKVSLNDLDKDIIDGKQVSVEQYREKAIDSIIYTMLSLSMVENEFGK